MENTMKISIHGLFLLLFSALQATLIRHIEIFSVKPDLLLVYVITICFFCPKTEGGAIGFVFGLFTDIMAGRLLGVNAVLMLIAGFTIAMFCENVFRGNNVFVVMAAAVIVTFVYNSVHYLFVFSLIGQLDYAYALKSTIWIECLYNAVLCLPMFFILKKITVFLYAEKE